MIILGLDLATATGYCYGRPNETPVAGTVRAPSTGNDLGAFGAFYWKFFSQTIGRLVGELDPDEHLLVNYEAPILPEKRWDPERKKMTGGTTVETTRKLQSLGVLLETVCEMHAGPIEVCECYISSMKKELTGKGRADKGMMVLAAQRAGIQLPSGDEAFDAADAFAAWRLAVRHKAPEFSPAWDRRVYGQLFRPPGNVR